MVIFLRGCSRRCEWCHNKHLQQGYTPVNITEVYQEILKAKSYISAVVISGGEPLDQLDATAMIAIFARNLGLKVGLHTSKRNEASTVLNFFDMVLISDPERDPTDEVMK